MNNMGRAFPEPEPARPTKLGYGNASPDPRKRLHGPEDASPGAVRHL